MKKALTIVLLLVATSFGTLVVAEGRETSQPKQAQVGTVLGNSLNLALYQRDGMRRRRRRRRRMRRRWWERRREGRRGRRGRRRGDDNRRM